MFVSIYYKPSLFNAHTMIFIVHIFMNVNKLCLNQLDNDKAGNIKKNTKPMTIKKRMLKQKDSNNDNKSINSKNNTFFCCWVVLFVFRWKYGSPYLVKAQQLQEQRYPFLSVCVEFWCNQTMAWLPVFGDFCCDQTMVWLPVFGDF